MFCIIFAQFATNLGSLIEAVNILGSWFYGVMLGIFLVAFYLKKVKGNAVFYAAILGEIVVIAMYGFTEIGWLWLNAIGAIAVVVFAGGYSWPATGSCLALHRLFTILAVEPLPRTIQRKSTSISGTT